MISECLIETQKKRQEANLRYMALRQAYMEEIIYFQQEKKTSLDTLKQLQSELRVLYREVQQYQSAAVSNKSIFAKIKFLQKRIAKLESENSELRLSNNNDQNKVSTIHYNPKSIVVTPFGEGEVVEHLSDDRVKIKFPFGEGVININSITPFTQSQNEKKGKGHNNNNNNININTDSEIENECEGIEIPSIITQPLPTNQLFHFYSQTNSPVPYNVGLLLSSIIDDDSKCLSIIESRNPINPDYEKWEADKRKLKDIQAEYRRAEQVNYLLLSTQKQCFQNNQLLKQKLDGCLCDLQQLRQDNKFLQDKLETLTGQKWKGGKEDILPPPENEKMPKHKDKDNNPNETGEDNDSIYLLIYR